MQIDKKRKELGVRSSFVGTYKNIKCSKMTTMSSTKFANNLNNGEQHGGGHKTIMGRTL
jgi:hypothetical protein